MHDPTCQAFEISTPIPPRHDRWDTKRTADRGAFSLRRRRRTNPENLGEPVYRWWRPVGYELRAFGRSWRWRTLVTVWHDEPRGADSGDVCKHYREVNGRRVPSNRWRWHVHHWHLQIHFEQKLRRFLLERCEECGRRYPWGYAPVSHSWSAPGSRWRDGVQRRSYHSECSGLVRIRGQRDATAASFARMLRRLGAYLDWTDEDILADVYQRKTRREDDGYGISADCHKVSDVLGWKFDTNRNMRSDEYILTGPDGRETKPHDHPLPLIRTFEDTR